MEPGGWTISLGTLWRCPPTTWRLRNLRRYRWSDRERPYCPQVLLLSGTERARRPSMTGQRWQHDQAPSVVGALYAMAGPRWAPASLKAEGRQFDPAPGNRS